MIFRLMNITKIVFNGNIGIEKEIFIKKRREMRV